jgi:aminoglycoside phosphotransferase (APT) family kinase protein
MDVLHMGHRRNRVILRRYWPPEPGEIDPSLAETRALDLAAENGIPAPAAIWRDKIGLFPERAIIISFLEGSVLLQPEDPMGWAAQLAHALVAIHRIEVGEGDTLLFPASTPGQDDHVSEEAVVRHPRGREIGELRYEALSQLLPVEPVYVHHDFWAGNTLWRDGELVAVVDWEGGSIGDPAIDVAYCIFDMRLLGMDEAATHFTDTYRHASGRSLENLHYWNLLALCRPMPDIGIWVPSWNAMGVDITVDEARTRHDLLIDEALRRRKGRL